MKRRLIISTAALAGLLVSGAAYAGSNNTATVVQKQSTNTANVAQSTGSNNHTTFTQDGAANSASITQTGDYNGAGNHDNINDGYGVVYQHGNDNQLTILQDNRDTVADGNAGAGSMLQTGNYNSANITQTGAMDAVIGATQTGLSTASALTNQLTVVQSNAPNNHYPDLPLNSSDYHYGSQYIGLVVQNNTGGLANTLTLTQTLGVYNAGDQIISVTQNGVNNAGTVTQNGRKNYLASLTQTGANNGSQLLLQGDSNGNNGVAFSSAAASGVGIGQAVISQSGGDTANYSAYGNSNLYGFVQSTGTGNSIVGTSTGNSNEVAIKQAGSGNVTDFTQLGNGNDIGVSLNGDGNGAGVFTTGVALSLDATTSLLSEGNVLQDSTSGASGNVASYIVFGSSNLFAFAQVGGNNTITGNVGDASHYSSGNQVAVLQQGSNNVATFTQTGTGGSNIAAITQ